MPPNGLCNFSDQEQQLRQVRLRIWWNLKREEICIGKDEEQYLDQWFSDIRA